MKYRRLNIHIYWTDVSDFQALTKNTDVHLTEYTANNVFSDSWMMPKDTISTSVTFVEDIALSNQKKLWEHTASVEYDNSWALVTSSNWYDTYFSGSGYYVTGSTPDSSGLNLPVMTSGSFDPGTVLNYHSTVPPQSCSYWYVTSSNAYNEWMENTSSLFYNQQIILK